MTTDSLTRLSDYFSKTVLTNFRSKSQTEISDALARIKLFESTQKTYLTSRDSIGSSMTFDNDSIKLVRYAVIEKMKLLDMDWSCSELSMKCVFAQFIPKSMPTNWVLVYAIDVGDVKMLFNCQLGEDGIFNYFLEVVSGKSNDYWNYYFERTPCALMSF